MTQYNKFRWRAIAACVCFLAAVQMVEAKQFVTVQPIQVCADDGSVCANIGYFEDVTNKIWAQADIQIHFLPKQVLYRSQFLHIDATSPGPAEDVALFSSSVASDTNPLILRMWFVDQIVSEAGETNRYGVACGPVFFECGVSSGVIISDDIFTYNNGIGRLDTISHEIGHSLGLTHDQFGAGGFDNVMSGRETRQVPSHIDQITPDGPLDNLTATQIAIARTSHFVSATPLPEPAASSPFALGVLGLLLFRLGVRRAGGEVPRW